MKKAEGCCIDGATYVRVFKEEGDCIVCLEMRADELMRRLISGELTNYRVVRTSPEPLQHRAIIYTTEMSKQVTKNDVRDAVHMYSVN